MRYALSPVRFTTTDTTLQRTFDWARDMALSYVHDGSDPVGLWYEAALPGRDAFCMRDVSHQVVGAALLGLDEHNRNMLSRIASNISESKDWEWEWLSGHEEYPSEPVGDEIQECLKIWNKYSKDILHLEDDFEYEADVEAYV